MAENEKLKFKMQKHKYTKRISGKKFQLYCMGNALEV